MKKSRVFGKPDRSKKNRLNLAAYTSAFRIRVLQNLQYRTAAIAGLATQFFWGFMLLMVFQAFYAGSDATPPMSSTQLASYIWLQQAFLVFVALWFRDMELFGFITSGNVAYELCRPTDLYLFWYVRLLAARIAGAALRCMPILCFAFILPPPYRLYLPQSFSVFMMFLVSLFFGVLVNVAISMFIYILTFVTLSPVGSLLIIGTIGEFCSGMIIPIPLMPAWLQQIVMVLPFRLASDLPFRVWSGHIGPKDALFGIVTQMCWLTVLAFTGQIAMKRVLKRMVVQGG